MRLFITGAAGFTGRYLIDEFVNNFHQEIEIYGLVHRYRTSEGQKGCHYVEGDLLNSDRMDQIISDISPDYIVHLAGINRGTTADLFNVNVVGTENVLNAVLRAAITPRILTVGSSAEYGYQGDDPIRENAPIQPLSTYGISKAASSMLAFLYMKKYRMGICIAKPFNITGPGQTKDFFCGNLISKILAFESGESDRIELINPESKRDYIDIRDVVRAYCQLICHPDFFSTCVGKLFNIGSGSNYSVMESFQIVEGIMGKKYPYHIMSSSQRDIIPSQRADFSFINAITGWQPKIKFSDSLRDMIKNNVSVISPESEDASIK